MMDSGGNNIRNRLASKLTEFFGFYVKEELMAHTSALAKNLHKLICNLEIALFKNTKISKLKIDTDYSLKEAVTKEKGVAIKSTYVIKSADIKRMLNNSMEPIIDEIRNICNKMAQRNDDVSLESSNPNRSDRDDVSILSSNNIRSPETTPLPPVEVTSPDESELTQFAKYGNNVLIHVCGGVVQHVLVRKQFEQNFEIVCFAEEPRLCTMKGALKYAMKGVKVEG